MTSKERLIVLYSMLAFMLIVSIGAALGQNTPLVLPDVPKDGMGGIVVVVALAAGAGLFFLKKKRPDLFAKLMMQAKKTEAQIADEIAARIKALPKQIATPVKYVPASAPVTTEQFMADAPLPPPTTFPTTGPASAEARIAYLTEQLMALKMKPPTAFLPVPALPATPAGPSFINGRMVG